MARGDIRQKISLEGGDEVRRQLQQMGQAGERAINSLGNAAGRVDRPLQQVGRSSGQVGFAVRNLSFQVNDLVTGFVSGQRPMQIFAQQGGQIFQAFQQGGGLSAVLGGVASGIRSMITPMRLAGVAAVTAAGGFAFLLSRAKSAEDSVKQFAVVLKGMGKTELPEILRGGSGQAISRPQARSSAAALGFDAAAKEQEKSAERLRDVGIGIIDARAQLLDALRKGVDPSEAERIIRIGTNLNAVLGDQAASEFVTAIGGGVEPLRKFADKARVVHENLTTVRDIIAAIETKYKGLADALKTPLDRALQDLGVAWQDVLNNAMKSDLIVSRSQESAAALRALSAAIETVHRSDWAGLAGGVLELVVGLTNLTPKLEGARNLLRTIGAAANLGLVAIKKALTDFDVWLSEREKAFWEGVAMAAAAVDASIRADLQGLSDWVSTNIGGAFKSIWETFTSAASSAISSVRGWLDGVFSKIREMANSIGGLFGGGGGSSSVVTSDPGQDFGGGGEFARGGLVRGRGTGTSDSILARLSNKEFVNTARAVRFWGPDFFHSLNRLEMPKFALGGLVDTMNTSLMSRGRGFGAPSLAAAAASGSPVHIHLGDRSFALRGEQNVVDALSRHARSRQVRSAGRAPGWVG